MMMFIDESSSKLILSKANELFESGCLKGYEFDQFGKINALLAIEAMKKAEKLYVGLTNKNVAHKQSVPLILFLAIDILKESTNDFPKRFNPNDYEYASKNKKYSYLG